MEIRPETQRLMVQGDPHPIAKYRVIGPLSKLVEIQQALSCKACSAMVRPPEKRASQPYRRGPITTHRIPRARVQGRERLMPCASRLGRERRSREEPTITLFDGGATNLIFTNSQSSDCSSGVVCLNGATVVWSHDDLSYADLPDGIEGDLFCYSSIDGRKRTYLLTTGERREGIKPRR